MKKNELMELSIEVIGRIAAALAFAGLCFNAEVGVLDWPAIYAIAAVYFGWKAVVVIRELIASR